MFYNRARGYHLYPDGADLIWRGVDEYFAITASVYLSGHADREPFDRETLKKRQPIYYTWLGRTFGVKK
jgi:hypothetical protein